MNPHDESETQPVISMVCSFSLHFVILLAATLVDVEQLFALEGGPHFGVSFARPAGSFTEIIRDDTFDRKAIPQGGCQAPAPQDIAVWSCGSWAGCADVAVDDECPCRRAGYHASCRRNCCGREQPDRERLRALRQEAGAPE